LVFGTDRHLLCSPLEMFPFSACFSYVSIERSTYFSVFSTLPHPSVFFSLYTLFPTQIIAFDIPWLSGSHYYTFLHRIIVRVSFFTWWSVFYKLMRCK
jgi:hypothetical protein